MDKRGEVLLSVQNLRKSYGSVQAVAGISFRVHRASVFTILGPNGAGKTTTLEILEGIRAADSGEIHLFGNKTRRVTEQMKQRIGVLLQDGNFEPYLKVREIVSLFASFFHRALPVDEVLKRVALTDKAGAMVKTLSGGQRQRLAVGVALVNDPELVFLDEPTTGLDPQARRNLWSIFQELQDAGKTLILTTHYMEEAEALSKHVCIMDHGSIIAEGSPEELARGLGQDSIIEFEVQDMEAKAVTALREFGSAVEHHDSTVVIRTQELTGAMANLLSWAREHDIPLTNLAVRHPHLEDVFLSLTGRRLRE
ncbi:MAG: ABC transporter ATP-binding protein [Candidatus Bipolaricaulota bacterium]